MDGTNEIREAAAMARQYRQQATTALSSGGGTAAQRLVLRRLDRNLARAARAWDQIADDLDALGRLIEGNTT